jgi:D-xylose transport system substrate-binding protein
MKRRTFAAAALLACLPLFAQSGPQPMPQGEELSGSPGEPGLAIGLSFADFASARWRRERDEMTRLLEAEGYEVLVQVANHDARLQNDQIRALADQGAKVIIVVAEDGDEAAAAVDDVSRRGVRVIAYDRRVNSANLAVYLSYDYLEIGRDQARGILAVKDSGRFVLLGGSPTDNAAHLFRAGQMEVLQPLLDSGQIRIVADQWVENWDPANARKVMQNIIKATKGAIDAVVASNDGTALGALEAMRKAGFAGKVPISGQDATAAGCNSIARGELTLTILKDIRDLVPLACDAADRLARGLELPGLVDHPLAELTGDRSLSGNAPCEFAPLSTVDGGNLKRLVVDSGFQSYDDVYSGIADPPAR